MTATVVAPLTDAQADAVDVARSLLSKVQAGEHDRCCDFRCVVCGGQGGCQTCDDRYVELADEALREVGIDLSVMTP